VRVTDLDVEVFALPKLSLKLMASVLSIGLVSACSAAVSGAGGDTSVLRLAAAVENDTFDPAQLTGGQKDQYWQAVYDTVLKLNYETQQPEPNVGTDWKYSENKTVLTVTLRDDVKFSDGSPLTGEAVAKNAIALRDGKGGSAYMMANLVDATAPNPTTVVYKLSAPDPAFLGYLTTMGGAVANPKAVGTPEIATTPAGSGPYVLDTKATVPGSDYVFTRNKSYWNSKAFPYEKLEITPIVEMSARLNALKSGQVQGAIIETSGIDEAKASGLRIKSAQTDWRGLMLADRTGVMAPALADVRVRQAINYALDKKSYLANIERGYGTLSTQIFLPDQPGYVDKLDKRYPYDPAKAKQLLAEAGYQDGFDLVIPAFDYRSGVQPVMIQQLAAVGIRVKTESVVPDQYNPVVKGGKYAAFWIQLTSGDPWRNVMKTLPADSAWNGFTVDDPEVTRLMDAARAAYGDDDAYKKAMGDISTYIVDNAFFVPWYRIESFYVTDTGTDFTFSPWATSPEVRTFKPADASTQP
jgi:peptide/nickel transport system substrate-binding protein